jgi:hypothetical protein
MNHQLQQQYESKHNAALLAVEKAANSGIGNGTVAQKEAEKVQGLTRRV